MQGYLGVSAVPSTALYPDLGLSEKLFLPRSPTFHLATTPHPASLSSAATPSSGTSWDSTSLHFPWMPNKQSWGPQHLLLTEGNNCHWIITARLFLSQLTTDDPLWRAELEYHLKSVWAPKMAGASQVPTEWKGCLLELGLLKQLRPIKLCRGFLEGMFMFKDAFTHVCSLTMLHSVVIRPCIIPTCSVIF